MKKICYLFLLLLSVNFLFSCSDQEGDISPENPQDIQPGLFKEALEVNAPEAMLSSEDAYAQMAVTYLTTVNSFTSYSNAFYPPEDARKSSTPISAANARVAAEYLVYEWSYGQQAVAYQYSEQNGKHVFEVFYKEGKDYLRYYYAEENKDGKSGLFKVFNITAEDPSEVLASWTWEILANESVKFVYDLADGGFRYEVMANKDQSGTIEISTEGAKYMYFEWDSTGKGSWEQYDENGQIVQSDEWAA